jgi:hypothetical protein
MWVGGQLGLVVSTLNGQGPAPALSVYALDAGLRPIATAAVDERGAFNLPEDVVQNAALMLFRPEQYRELVKGDDVITLARERWSLLFPPFWRCVSGRVRRLLLAPLAGRGALHRHQRDPVRCRDAARDGAGGGVAAVPLPAGSSSLYPSTIREVAAFALSVSRLATRNRLRRCVLRVARGGHGGARFFRGRDVDRGSSRNTRTTSGATQCLGSALPAMRTDLPAV